MWDWTWAWKKELGWCRPKRGEGVSGGGEFVETRRGQERNVSGGLWWQVQEAGGWA